MSTAVRRAIYGKMAGDTTLNNLLGAPPSGVAKSIYHDIAPPQATYPFVLLSKQAGTPTYAMATDPAFETDVWLIKAVDRGHVADGAEAAAARLITLLNDGVLTISGAVQLYLRRQSDVEYPETEDGVQFHHVGGLYRLLYD